MKVQGTNVKGEKSQYEPYCQVILSFTAMRRYLHLRTDIAALTDIELRTDIEEIVWTYRGIDLRKWLEHHSLTVSVESRPGIHNFKHQHDFVGSISWLIHRAFCIDFSR